MVKSSAATCAQFLFILNALDTPWKKLDARRDGHVRTTCHECGRKSAAVGGLLFRCECCTRAYCEDHLPQGAEIIGKCKRFEALGQIHPAQACFIRCDADCQKFGEEHEEIKKYNAGGDEHGGGVKWIVRMGNG